MKKIVMMLALVLMATFTATAQEKKADAPKPAPKPTETLPTVDVILDKYVKAIGGKEAIEKITSQVGKGTFELPSFGASGSIETYAKAPNKTAMTIDIGGFGKVESVFDGTKGWSADPQSGLRELSGTELAMTKRDADLYRSLKLKSQYTKIEVTGKEKVGDSEAYVVTATPAEGKPEKMYFDVNSGLMTRMDVEVESPQGAMAFKVFLEDYKPVDGVKVPYTVRRESDAFGMVIKYTEVKHNVAVEDTKFNKPSGN
ncbi:MAG: hypothetical protein M3X11_00515 [Acidobacteriota bacterium]|nr:hypothetical protein [Acidobacteriota bacterium]